MPSREGGSVLRGWTQALGTSPPREETRGIRRPRAGHEPPHMPSAEYSPRKFRGTSEVFASYGKSEERGGQLGTAAGVQVRDGGAPAQPEQQQLGEPFEDPWKECNGSDCTVIVDLSQW